MAYNLRQMKTREGFEKLFNGFRNEVVEKFQLDFSSSDLFYSYNKSNFAYLKEIYEANSFPDYMFKKLKAANAANKLSDRKMTFYKNEIIAIRSSYSYRIGRFITFIPRKIRGVVRCYRDHGMRYTLREIKKKLGSLFKK